mgnify:CR=1 FL=1
MMNKTGFTENENACHDALMECYARYCELPQQHPQELAEVTYAIHQIQGLLATRIVRRCYPDGWPTHKDGGKRQSQT